MLSARTQPGKSPWQSARTHIIRIFTLLILLNAIPLSSVQLADAAGALGLRIDVLPNSSSVDSEPYAQNRRLWLITSEPKPTTRTIRITSSVNNAQLINLEIAAAKRSGDSTELDQERKSELSPWTKFSKKTFILPAFGQEDIQITIDPPSDLTDYSQDAFLIVKSAATTAPKIDQTRTTAVLASQFQYATPLFYGVGNIENLVSIQIKDVDTYLDENGKYAEVEIVNNGVGPVEIAGDIQFSNLDFQSANIGPLNFTLPPLQPGKTGYGLVRLPDQMIAGKWKIFVQAYVGSYGEAVVITKDLSFDYKKASQIPRLMLLFGSFLLLIGLIALQRRLRSRAPESSNDSVREEISPQPSIKSKFPHFSRVSNQQSSDLVDEDFEAWLESIKESAASGRALKKPGSKKSPVKTKKVARKTPAKKAVVKKSTSKSSPKKKATADRKPVKKAPARKKSVG
jgi:hypothetical protein